LRVLAIGINPSLHAVRAGYPFAFARNRFWPALNASQLISEPLVPGPAAMRVLARRYGIGFTDVVKRPTPGMKDLSAAEFAAGAVVLAAKLARYRPPILWFHGKVAARAYLRHAGLGDHEPVWGVQPFRVAGAACFISPNPSPANASHGFADIVASYDELARLIARFTAAAGMR
jgi:TDG/mug DNA glycosylase family protein